VKQDSAFPIGFGVTMEGGEAKKRSERAKLKYKMMKLDEIGGDWNYSSVD